MLLVGCYLPVAKVPGMPTQLLYADGVAHTAAGNVSLPMPTMQIDDMDAAVNDIEVISELERVMAEWCAALTDIVQGEADKHPTGSGPLAGRPCCPMQACNACFVVVELSLASLAEMLKKSATIYMIHIWRCDCADHADTSWLHC